MVGATAACHPQLGSPQGTSGDARGGGGVLGAQQDSVRDSVHDTGVRGSGLWARVPRILAGDVAPSVPRDGNGNGARVSLVEPATWLGGPVALACMGIDAGDAAAVAAEVEVLQRVVSAPHPHVAEVIGYCAEGGGAASGTSSGGKRHVMAVVLSQGPPAKAPIGLPPPCTLENLLSHSRVEVRVCASANPSACQLVPQWEKECDGWWADRPRMPRCVGV